MKKKKSKFRKGGLTYKLHVYRRLGIFIGMMIFSLTSIFLNYIIKDSVTIKIPFSYVVSIIFGVLGFLFMQSLVLNEMEIKKREINKKRFEYYYMACVNFIKQDNYENAREYYNNYLSRYNDRESMTLRGILIGHFKYWDKIVM